MRYIQRFTRDGKDLVLSIYEMNGKLVGSRRWQNAAQYIHAERERDGTTFMLLAVPVEAGLNVQAAP